MAELYGHDTRVRVFIGDLPGRGACIGRLLGWIMVGTM